MGDCGSCAYIPRERILAVCDWALARIEEIRQKKDKKLLQDQAKSRNWWRRLVRMKPLNDADVHKRLLRETDSFGLPKHDYPWRYFREREFDELLTLARDAAGGVRVSGEDWRGMLQWCRNNGWIDKKECQEQAT